MYWWTWDRFYLSLSIIVKVRVRNKCSCSVVKKYKNNFANENFTNPLLLHYSKGKCPCSKLGPGNLITQKSKLLIVLLNPNFRKNEKNQFPNLFIPKTDCQIDFLQGWRKKMGDALFLSNLLEILSKSLTTFCNYSWQCKLPKIIYPPVSEARREVYWNQAQKNWLTKESDMNTLVDSL